MNEPTEGGKYRSAEFYISPPIKKPLATGDILVIEGKEFVIISPSCDISKRSIEGKDFFNVELITITEIIPLQKNYFDNNKIPYSTKAKTTSDAWKNHMTSVKSGQKLRFHYLPGYASFAESVIDFKRIRHIPIETALKIPQENRKATISTPFIRDIQSRFSSYYGRQGQPEIER